MQDLCCIDIYQTIKWIWDKYCVHIFTFSKNMNDRKLVESYIMYFFMQKIDKINQLIDMQSSLEMSKAGEKGCADSDTCSGLTFANFKTLSQEQVSELNNKAAKKSRPLDPMLTSVVLEVSACHLNLVNSLAIGRRLY